MSRLSLGFPIKGDSNQSPQLQRPARKLKFAGSKLSKGAKIRNQYNQVPHLTQDTNGKVSWASRNTQKVCKSRYNTFQNANNKGADQTAQMRRLVCVFVVCKHRRQVFSR